MKNRPEWRSAIPVGRPEWGRYVTDPFDEVDASLTESTLTTLQNLIVLPGHSHDGTGSNTTVTGDSATATGSSSVTYGDSATNDGTNNVVVGHGASANSLSSSSVVVGETATMNPGVTQSGVVIGKGASATPAANAIGAVIVISPSGGGVSGDAALNVCTGAATVSAARAILIASGAKNDSVTGTAGIMITTGATAKTLSGARTIQIGSPTNNPNKADCVAIGDNTDTSAGVFGVALGSGAVTTKANQVMLARRFEVVTQPGGQEWRIEAISAAKTMDAITASEFSLYVRCNATTAAFAFTLIPATGSGRIVIVKKIDASANAVTVTADTTGTADLIDGAATVVLAAQYDTVFLIDAAANAWDIIQFGSP